MAPPEGGTASVSNESTRISPEHESHEHPDTTGALVLGFPPVLPDTTGAPPPASRPLACATTILPSSSSSLREHWPAAYKTKHTTSPERGTAASQTHGREHPPPPRGGSRPDRAARAHQAHAGPAGPREARKAPAALMQQAGRSTAVLCTCSIVTAIHRKRH